VSGAESVRRGNGSREQLIEWVKQKRARGDVVHAVYESCGFGYTLHEELVATGAHCIVTRPMRLNLERRRKNDRMDGRELCVRLSRYLAVKRAVCRPSAKEQNEFQKD